MLGIPTVVDRVIQQALAQVLGPLFDPDFSVSSFGFRPNRSAHHAVKQIQSYIKTGYRVAVDMDLAKFFDRVNHDALMARVARKVHDKALLRLIGSVWSSFLTRTMDSSAMRSACSRGSIANARPSNVTSTSSRRNGVSKVSAGGDPEPEPTTR